MTGTALVVGGNRGIGRHVALGLGRAGWTVAAASVTGARDVARAARAEGLTVQPALVDVRDDGTVRALRGWWDASHQGLDALVITAGTAVTGTMAEVEPDDVTRMLNEHVVGAYRVVRAFRQPLVRSRGQVVLVLSRMGRRPGRYGHAYGTAKAALAHLAGCLADELADDGVRVNCVSPGSVDTDMLRAVLPDRAGPGVMMPEEVARIIVHLVGPDFVRVNAAIIDVPGR